MGDSEYHITDEIEFVRENRRRRRYGLPVMPGRGKVALKGSAATAKINKSLRGHLGWDFEMKWKGELEFDSTWEELMREVGVELDMDYEDVLRINGSWWRFVREMLYRVEMPRIIMPGFGTLRASVSKLRLYCENYAYLIEQMYFNKEIGKGSLDKMEAHNVELQETCMGMEAEIERRRELLAKRKLVRGSKKDKSEVGWSSLRQRYIRMRMGEARQLRLDKGMDKIEIGNKTKVK